MVHALRYCVSLASMAAMTVGSVEACPIEELVQINKEPLRAESRVEVSVTRQQSTEGGQWQIYFRANGTLHSIIRLDLGETGQKELRVSFLDRRNFVVVSTTRYYDAPIEPLKDVKIESEITKLYFFCDEMVYLPVVTGDEMEAARESRETKYLRSLILDAEEISAYLNLLK